MGRGPDGNHAKLASWDEGATPIRTVEAAWFDGVTVILPWLASTSMFDTIKVEARCANRDRTWSVEIRGGNTNAGDADRYEQAIRDYTRAVEIARTLEGVLAETPEYWALDHTDTDITEYIVMGQPDYVLALFVLRYGYDPATEESRFAYERDAPALPAIRENMGWPRLDLAQLRERATALARSLHEQAEVQS